MATTYSVTGRTMVLDEATSVAWEDAGPLGTDTRRELRRDATILSEKLGSMVEIHSADGITLDAVTA